MKKKTLVSSTIAILIIVSLFSFVASTNQFSRNLASAAWFGFFAKKPSAYEDYETYIPGDSDDERWSWIAREIKFLSQANREQVEVMLRPNRRANLSSNALVFRITARKDVEDAFLDRFCALRINFGSNRIVDKIEIFHVENEYNPTASHH